MNDEARVPLFNSLQGLQSKQEYRMHLPVSDEEIAEETERWCRGKHSGDQRFSQFRGCISAVDGSLVPLKLIHPDFKIEAFRTRKVSWLCRSVIAVQKPSSV